MGGCVPTKEKIESRRDISSLSANKDNKEIKSSEINGKVVFGVRNNINKSKAS